MVGVKATPAKQASYIRKIRKPMVEKQRRERMNNSITQLKSLIAQTIKQNTAPMTRVDKADILELTVYHLTQLQQQQQSVSLATEAAAYRSGYSACAREAVTYLTNTKMTSPDVTVSLSNHLHRTVSQHNAPRNGNYFHHSGMTRQTYRLSTPLRPCDILNSPLPEMNLSGYSPIQNGSGNLPELKSSFISASLNSSSSTDVSSSCSNMSVSSNASNQSEISCKNDVRKQQYGINDDNDEDTGVVTIGDGKENEIGHVIKDVLWRPF